ncbi:Error-prone DNA polymerase [compost metagenome]
MVTKFEEKLINGMTGKGYSEDFAKRVFKQLEGFGSYGFPESHAASFALLVYVSCWLKCYYPDIFATALLNSMPMGFYQPAQIVIDAKKHGVEVRPIDINYSAWDNLLEEKSGKYHALRLGFRQIKGIREEDIEALTTKRNQGYKHPHELMDAGVNLSTLERLADADAFGSMGLDRRQALWEVSAMADRPIALFENQPSESTLEIQAALPLMSKGEHVIQDYASTSLSLKAHPVSFVREQLTLLRVIPTKDLSGLKDGQTIKVAGLVLVRQRPGTAKGVCFITIEDETGFTNLVVFENQFEKFRKEIIQSRLLMVEGKLQIEGEVIHIIVKRCFDLTGMLRTMDREENGNNPEKPFSKYGKGAAHYSSREGISGKIAAAKSVIPEGRNFK